MNVGKKERKKEKDKQGNSIESREIVVESKKERSRLRLELLSSEKQKKNLQENSPLEASSRTKGVFCMSVMMFPPSSSYSPLPPPKSN